jgi:hypothetical protein
MKLELQMVSDWPKLAWVADFERNTKCIRVMHGSHVEGRNDWCVEAIWTGDFSAGDFDLTDQIYGTGIRIRDDRVVFVTAGTMLDRLWHCEHQGRFYVGNTLPGLLARAGLSLSDDYLSYPDDMKTMREGLSKYKRTIPTLSSDVHVAYYNNLVYDGTAIQEIPKPDNSPDFNCYVDYHGFLLDTARKLGRNMSDTRRKYPITPLGGISSGYDSGASTVVAREAGCRKAVTIENASSLLPRSDSGMEIAKYLDIECTPYQHTPAAYKNEESVWGLVGRPAGLNLTIFDFPGPLCAFFTGYRGDSVWAPAILNRPDPFWTFSVDGLALCEFRLTQGLFHCVVPFWGAQKINQIQEINFQKDMEPWKLNRDYDRPIPRRIMEEAGVPRHLFGNRKEATSAECFFQWPFTPEGKSSFATFLKDRGLYAPSNPTIWALRKIVHLDHLVYVNLTHKFGWHRKGLRFVFKLKGQKLLFHWGNHAMKEKYQRALPEGGSVEQG